MSYKKPTKTAFVKAYKVGVDIPVTDVDADLPLLEKVAVDNGKLEDVYGVYGNGCIGINKRENCNMLQKSLVTVAKNATAQSTDVAIVGR